MKNLATGIVTMLAMLTTGCATVMNDDTQTINVRTSNNTAVKANISGEQITTPASVNVTRAKDDLIITTANENCASSTTVESGVDSVFFVNILSGGGIGSTTDYASEKMWEYDSDVVLNCNN